MSRDDLAALILRAVAQRQEEIDTRPQPPRWKVYEAAGDADDREYGPRYTPTWFGERGETEARRVRLLRTVYRLADAGLLAVVKSEGGRLERVRLTDEGRAAVAELPAA